MSTEASSQSTPEMDSKEVQVVSKVQDAQVQTKNTTKGVDAMTQSVVKSQSRSMQSKPSVRALHTQTIRDLLVDRSTQYEAKQNEAVTQTSLIASALTMDEWQNLEQVLSSMQVDLGEKISSYHSRKSSKNFNRVLELKVCKFAL